MGCIACYEISIDGRTMIEHWSACSLSEEGKVRKQKAKIYKGLNEAGKHYMEIEGARLVASW
jgi:hypothetical protein